MLIMKQLWRPYVIVFSFHIIKGDRAMMPISLVLSYEVGTIIKYGLPFETEKEENRYS